MSRLEPANRAQRAARPSAWCSPIPRPTPGPGPADRESAPRPERPGRRRPGPLATGEPRSLRGGFIGAGNFASAVLLPAVAARAGARRCGGSARRVGLSSLTQARRHGFRYVCGEAREILDDPETHAVFIATRHDRHAALLLEALRAGKHASSWRSPWPLDGRRPSTTITGLPRRRQGRRRALLDGRLQPPVRPRHGRGSRAHFADVHEPLAADLPVQRRRPAGRSLGARPRDRAAAGSSARPATPSTC